MKDHPEKEASHILLEAAHEVAGDDVLAHELGARAAAPELRRSLTP